jgi:PTS system mannose-specific IIC component
VTGDGSVLVAALAAGLAAVERKGALQVMISRPLVLGPILGWTLGDPVGGLFVAAPLELLWSGAANLGAVLPQHETAATIVIVSAAVAAGGSSGVDPALAFASFLLFAPVALLGRALEAFSEAANDRVAVRAAETLAAGDPTAAMRLHLTGLVWPFFGAATMCTVAALLGGPLLSALRTVVEADGRRVLTLGWALLWAVGGAAAVRAARLPRSLALAIFGAVFVLVVLLAVGKLI